MSETFRILVLPGDGIGPAMMERAVRVSMGMPREAALVEQACIDALAAGARTPDLGGTLNTS
ncbi:MAG TPA: hypothetical protein VK596_02295 [Edaphobacter sp.]|nr:hypothetical protein [Edaphobacter sp.]